LTDREIGFRIVFAVLGGQVDNRAYSLFQRPNFVKSVDLTLFYGQDWHDLKQRAEEFGSTSNSSTSVQVFQGWSQEE